MNSTTFVGLGFGKAQPAAKSSILDRITAKSPAKGLLSFVGQVDDGVSSFVSHATQISSLAALSGSALAYRLARLGILGLEGASLLRSAASVGAGLAAEVSTFELSQRGLQGDGGHLWKWRGIGGMREGLLQSLVTFGALKGAGRLAQGQNLIAQHLLQDSSMVLGHQISFVAGITPRPDGNLAQQFLHAEATTLQLAAGMALAHGLAPGLKTWDRGLSFSFKGPAADRFSHPFLLNEAFAGIVAAEKTGSSLGEKSISSPWVLMVGKKDPPPTLKPPPVHLPVPSSESKRPDTADVDASWDETTPVRSYRIPPAEASSPDSSVPSRPFQPVQTGDILRSFVYELKDEKAELFEAIRDFLAFCRTENEGKKELAIAVMELRERAKLVLTPEQKTQYLLTYNLLTKEMHSGDPSYWKELEALGNTLKNHWVDGEMKKSFSSIFIRLAEKLWQERPAVAMELRETFEILREIYGNEKLSPVLRGRAMVVYSEFASFIEK